MLLYTLKQLVITIPTSHFHVTITIASTWNPRAWCINYLHGECKQKVQHVIALLQKNSLLERTKYFTFPAGPRFSIRAHTNRKLNEFIVLPRLPDIKIKACYRDPYCQTNILRQFNNKKVNPNFLFPFNFQIIYTIIHPHRHFWNA